VVEQEMSHHDVIVIGGGIADGTLRTGADVVNAAGAWDDVVARPAPRALSS
jgi:glycerol-3-phosphate dehydrogenase